MQPAPWYNSDGQAALAQLETTTDGLSGAEARERLSRYGANALPEKPRRPVLVLFL